MLQQFLNSLWLWKSSLFSPFVVLDSQGVSPINVRNEVAHPSHSVELFTRCQHQRWSDNDDSLYAVGFMQSAEITVDSWHRENAGKRVTELQKFESNSFTLEGSITSAISKALLASSATLWITYEEFFQTIFWPTLTVIMAGRNAMSLVFTVPFSAVAGFCGAFRSLGGPSRTVWVRTGPPCPHPTVTHVGTGSTGGFAFLCSHCY